MGGVVRRRLRRAVAVDGLAREHVGDRLVDARHRDFSAERRLIERLHAGDLRVLRAGAAGADADDVHAGADGGDAAALHAVVVGDGLHLDAVGEDNAVKADVLAQDARHNRGGHGRRNPRLDLREEDVRGHDGPGGLLPAERAVGR